MPPAARTTPTTTPACRPSRGRVLVAEDDLSLRELLVGALCRRGFESVGVADGQQARKAIEKGWASARSVALLITDLQMPRGEGLELLAFVAASPHPIEVIVISSFLSRERREQAERSGARAVFSKPFDLHQLLDTVGTLLGR